MSKLELFAVAVLNRMEKCEEWNSDLVAGFEIEASRLGLADSDEHGYFRVARTPEQAETALEASLL